MLTHIQTSKFTARVLLLLPRKLDGTVSRKIGLFTEQQDHKNGVMAHAFNKHQSSFKAYRQFLLFRRLVRVDTLLDRLPLFNGNVPCAIADACGALLWRAVFD